MSELLIFFFKQKTAYEMRISDWSSDVCSSDLLRRQVVGRPAPRSRWNNDTPAAAEVQANRLREKQRCQATNGNSTGSVGLRAPGRGPFASPLLSSQSACGLEDETPEALARAACRRARKGWHTRRLARSTGQDDNNAISADVPSHH